jgi:hypothetical protein
MLGDSFGGEMPMHLADSEVRGWTPSSEEDKAKVRRQLNRLLQTSHFKNSRRYPLLFRFIVEETLAGRGSFLKERLLGVSVFDRPADYDTASDPIVRVTIAEIRKRIAQYYHEEAHDSEMRIELLPGSYVPEFRPSKEAGADHHHMPMQVLVAEEYPVIEEEHLAELAAAQERSPAPSSNSSLHKSRLSRLVRIALASATAVLVLLAAGLLWRWAHPSALDELWRPVLAKHQTVTFCLPVMSNSGEATAAAAGILVQDPASTSGRVNAPDTFFPKSAPNSTFLALEILGENIVFSDALATVQISNYLAVHNHHSSLRLNTVTTLNDLRQGPVVLIGGLDNQWTLRALAPLRYRFAGTPEQQFWIVDTKKPDMKDWKVDVKVSLSDVQRDYAIIARIHDESTGQVEMVVAGIGMSGTAAAGEFLVDPVQIAELRRRVGAGFRDRDFEAVLSTDVVNGIAGSPTILTVAVQ